MELTGMVAVGTADELASAMLTAQARGFPVSSVPLGGGRYRLTIGAMPSGSVQPRPVRPHQCAHHHGHVQAPHPATQRPTIPAWVFAPGAVGILAAGGAIVWVVAANAVVVAIVAVLVILGGVGGHHVYAAARDEIKKSIGGN